MNRSFLPRTRVRRLSGEASRKVFNSAANGSGSSALLAADLVYGEASGAIPDNQWHLETKRWFETALVKMQSYILRFASQPPTQSHQEFVPAEHPDILHQCEIQRIQASAQVQNFSFLGIALLVGVALILTVVQLSVEGMSKKISRNSPKRLSLLEAWAADEALELWRAAVDPESKEDWNRSRLGVPYIKFGPSFVGGSETSLQDWPPSQYSLPVDQLDPDQDRTTGDSTTGLVAGKVAPPAQGTSRLQHIM